MLTNSIHLLLYDGLPCLRSSFYQLGKSNPKSAVDIRASGIPWWWNWLDHQLPPGNDSESQSAVKDVHLTPPRTISEHKPSPWRLSHNFRHLHLDNDSHESVTPRSTKSAVPLRGKLMHTPRRTSSPMSSTSISNYSRRRASAANSPFSHSFKDDDSLTSCPPFSGPSYMSPTISARAKFRGKSIPEERNTGRTPSNSSRRRLSFPLTPRSGKDATSLRDHESTGDHMSVGSTASTPSVVGRKPFNRFVWLYILYDFFWHLYLALNVVVFLFFFWCVFIGVWCSQNTDVK